MNNHDPKIILALDFAEDRAVFDLIEKLQPAQCRLKVGKELFTRYGPGIVRKLINYGFDVFLDLKYHDIPNTVAKACLAAADLGVWMLNVHALGGSRMMSAARTALGNLKNPPLLIAVTILTSMDNDDLNEIGIGENTVETAIRLAIMAKDEGLDGVVCSALEARSMREKFGSDFCLITPGIRMEEDAHGDQRRVMTPVAALSAGAHYLVMGRPVTHAEDPAEKLLRINSDIKRNAG